MLFENSTIWETRIQSVDFLLTASAGDRKELYYLATVCQLSLDPILISHAVKCDHRVADDSNTRKTFTQLGAPELLGPGSAPGRQ